MSAVDHVLPADWVQVLGRCRADGFTLLDLLTGIDRGAQVEIVARVVDPGTSQARLLGTIVDDRIDSATGVYPGASWHERETAEMFGISFDGLADRRPLLLREPVVTPPLRKTALLAARLEREWPGSGGSRKTRPLGVPAEGAP